MKSMKFSLVLFLLIFNQPLFAKTLTVLLGTTPIKIIQECGKNPTKKTLVHLHENEKTALTAARQYLKKEGGMLITLKHRGARNIAFCLEQVRYEFDPNRIFTDRGIKASLMQFGPYSQKAHQAVKALAQQILLLIPQGKVIAVHNNREYSLKDYFPQQTLSKDAKYIYYFNNSNFRNFYFVTNPGEYYRLKKLKLNVALQAPSARDDGSLSFYLAKDNYINIEAQHGELKAQLKMLYYS